MISHFFLENWVDLSFILIIAFFILTNRGFIGSTLDLAGFFFSIIFSFRTYSLFANSFMIYGGLSQGLSKAIGFFLAWFMSEIIFHFVSKYIAKKIPSDYINQKVDAILGFIPSAMQGTIFFAFVLTLVVALPVGPNIKKDILASDTGSTLLSYSLKLETSLRSVFNDALTETMNFVSIKPESQERINLNFQTSSDQLAVDSQSEAKMFNLVNLEREKKGLNKLKFDTALQGSARNYAKLMFLNNFFSHYSKTDGSSPADRLEKAGIEFVVTGENLAYAPEVEIAHTGLMNSEGHRKNILSPEFAKVGIGVIDAGIYGKMFVQEFTD